MAQQEIHDTVGAISGFMITAGSAIVANSQYFLPVAQFLVAIMGIAVGIVTFIKTYKSIKKMGKVNDE